MVKKEITKWDYREDYLAGLKAYELAREFKAALEPRLPGSARFSPAERCPERLPPSTPFFRPTTASPTLFARRDYCQRT